MQKSAISSKPETLDASGLSCPLPVLRAHKVLRTMPQGAVLELFSTDPVSKDEVPAFCEQAGHHLLSVSEESGKWHFLIERG